MITFISKEVKVHGRRTRIGLSFHFWEALDEICRRERMSRNQFLSDVEAWQSSRSLTEAVRVAVMLYYRRLARGGGASSADANPTLVRSVMEMRP